MLVALLSTVGIPTPTPTSSVLSTDSDSGREVITSISDLIGVVLKTTPDLLRDMAPTCSVVSPGGIVHALGDTASDPFEPQLPVCADYLPPTDLFPSGVCIDKPAAGCSVEDGFANLLGSRSYLLDDYDPTACAASTFEATAEVAATVGLYDCVDYARGAYYLSGKTLSITVDLSSAGCGCNAAFYLCRRREHDEPWPFSRALRKTCVRVPRVAECQCRRIPTLGTARVTTTATRTTCAASSASSLI